MYIVEPCGIDFWQSVGIGIGFLLKCRFSVGIGFGFEIEKSPRFFSVFFRFFGFLKKTIFLLLLRSCYHTQFGNMNMAQQSINFD
jgi:hypothetical protein